MAEPSNRSTPYHGTGARRRVLPRNRSISDATRCHDETCGCSCVLHSTNSSRETTLSRRNRSRMRQAWSQPFPPIEGIIPAKPKRPERAEVADTSELPAQPQLHQVAHTQAGYTSSCKTLLSCHSFRNLRQTAFCTSVNRRWIAHPIQGDWMSLAADRD